MKRDRIHSVDSNSIYDISVKRFGKATHIAGIEVAEEGEKPIPQGLKPACWAALMSRLKPRPTKSEPFVPQGKLKLRSPEKRTFFAAGMPAAAISAAILTTAALAIAGAVFAQDAPAKKAPAGGGKASAAAVARGKEIFDNKCGICHYADSDAKKIGPGLKGIGKRGTFTVNNNKVTDESLKTWIENGDSLMPPFKEVLEAPQIKDVVAYVRTL